MEKNIVFCFPYRFVGGVSSQFLRVAVNLKSLGNKVYIVDYKDGAMGRECRVLGLTLIEYSDDALATIPEDSVLVFQAMNPWTIWRKLCIPLETKLFFWVCHVDNFTPAVPILTKFLRKPRFGKIIYQVFFPSLYRKMKAYIADLDCKGSLVFIDQPCKDGIEELYDLSLRHDSYIPVPFGMADPNFSPKNHASILLSDSEVSFSKFGTRKNLVAGWIGRIADFKYPVLKHTIHRLSAVATSLNIHVDFHVIGNGEFLEKLKKDVKYIRNVDVTFHGEMSQVELTQLVRNSIKLVFAMGTSALESASNSVPTVLLNFSYDPIKFHEYRWLHTQTGFSVGAKLDSKKISDDDGLKTILEELLYSQLPIGQLARLYVVKNHSLNTVSSKFISKVADARYTFSELKSSKVYMRPLAYKTYKFIRG